MFFEIVNMSLIPQSPRIGRSPKLKAKWLSNTMAFQYGSNGAKKSEIIVLTNDLDQYLQDIFQSIDTKNRGKISGDEFRLLCDVLNLRETTIKKDVQKEMGFKDFHDRLCEHFACYGDYTGFLVNQTFRAVNTCNGKDFGSKRSLSDHTRLSNFQKKLSKGQGHRCIHDAELFKNWDKLRLSGFRLSELKEHIDHMLYEVAYHKEESQTLKEIIEDLRAMLQASDTQNIGMQVALKKYHRNLVTSSGDMLCVVNNRHSMPVDSNVLVYKPLKGEEKSVCTLSRELDQLRELRDKEVKELINFNNQLQQDLTDMSREVVRLEDENRRQAGQLDLIVKTYRCCRELFAVCVESFKEVENSSSNPQSPTSGPQSPLPLRTPTQTPSLKRKFSFSGSTRPVDNISAIKLTDNIDMASTDSEADDHFPPEVILIKRLEHEIITLHETSSSQQQEMARLESELVMCRRHLQTANFQVEALETECSRLLALEDQLVSVFRLLQKGRSQCLSRKTLGQLLLDVIDSSFGEDEQDMTADQFIRILQKTLSDCPLFILSS